MGRQREIRQIQKKRKQCQLATVKRKLKLNYKKDNYKWIKGTIKKINHKPHMHQKTL